MGNDGLVFLFIFQDYIEQGDPVVWIHKWQFCQSELIQNVISSSKSLELYVQKVFKLQELYCGLAYFK